MILPKPGPGRPHHDSYTHREPLTPQEEALVNVLLWIVGIVCLAVFITVAIEEVT